MAHCLLLNHITNSGKRTAILLASTRLSSFLTWKFAIFQPSLPLYANQRSLIRNQTGRMYADKNSSVCSALHQTHNPLIINQ